MYIFSKHKPTVSTRSKAWNRPLVLVDGAAALAGNKCHISELVKTKVSINRRFSFYVAEQTDRSRSNTGLEVSEHPTPNGSIMTFNPYQLETWVSLPSTPHPFKEQHMSLLVDLLPLNMWYHWSLRECLSWVSATLYWSFTGTYLHQ